MGWKNIHNILLYYRPLHWAMLIFAFLLLIAIQGEMSTRPEDFCQYYYSAKNFLNHKSLYQPINTVECKYNINIVRTRYNVYPPTTTLLFIPFAFLPLKIASIIWSFLGLAFYLAAIILLLFMLRWLSIRTITVALFASLISFPFLSAATEHNLSQLLFLLLSLAWVYRKNNRPDLAGILLGITVLLKVWPIFLFIGMLLIGQKKLAAFGFATISIGIICAYLLFGQNIFIDYAHIAVMADQQWFNYPTNVSLVGAVAKLFIGYGPSIPPLIKSLNPITAIHIGYIVSIAFGIISLIFILLCSKKVPQKDHELLIEGLLVTTSLLVFPLLWDHSIIILLLPCTVMLLQYRQHFKFTELKIAILIICLAFLLNPKPLLYGLAYLDDTIAQGFIYIVVTINLIIFCLMQGYIALKIMGKRKIG